MLCATQVISAMWSWMETPPRMWKPLKPWCAGCMTAALATAASTTGGPGSVCGYTGIIGDECPNCHRTEADGPAFERIRRITGYLVGTLDRFNDGKRAEERDRVKHSIGGSDERLV